MNKSKAGCIYPGCNHDALEKSEKGYCIFHALAEEKDEKEFKDALRNYINEIDAKGRDHYFEGFIFVGDIDFSEDFQVIVFTEADFEKAQLKKGADFEGPQFKGKAYFEGARFEGEAYFEGAQFEGEAYFGEARFEGKAYFGRAQFKGGAYFEGAQFEEEAYFGETRFEGKAYFESARFKEGLRLSPMYIKGYASFAGAVLENSTLTPLNLDRKAIVDFTDARLRNTQMKREDIDCYVVQERNKDFFEAKEIYLLLKNNFHSLGRYDDESWAFRQEKEMARKSFWHFRKEYREMTLGEKLKKRNLKDCFYSAFLDLEHKALYIDECIKEYLESCGLRDVWQEPRRLFSYFVSFLRQPIKRLKNRARKIGFFLEANRRKRMGRVSRKELVRVLWFHVKYPIKYLWSTFLKYLYGWGEWPWLIFIWCFVTIFICSLLYYFWGTVITDSGIPITAYLKKLYFSGITFTALGYGDYSPIGWARILAFFESFLGVFFIALFVFSFARRTGGR